MGERTLGVKELGEGKLERREGRREKGKGHSGEQGMNEINRRGEEETYPKFVA